MIDFGAVLPKEAEGIKSDACLVLSCLVYIVPWG